MLVEINLKVRYRQTAVGFFWVILNPIILYTVQAALFGQILHRTDPSYYFYLLSGLLPWFYLSQTAQMGCNYINSNANLIKNLKIHPLKLITGLALENYVNLICASLLIYFYIFLTFPSTLISFFIYIAASLWLLLLVILLTFISALLNVLFKDTNYILHFVFTILYFMTPTFFYTENLPTRFQEILKYNPFYWIIGLFRIDSLSLFSFKLLFINLIIMLFTAFLAGFIWKKYKNKIYLKL